MTGRHAQGPNGQATRVDLLLARFPLVGGHPDVAGLLCNPDALRALGPALAHPYRDQGVTRVVAPEARGLILGALVAVELGAGLVLARKTGRNHPGADRAFEVGPTWRGSHETFQTRSADIQSGDRVLAVDDWITTGSTLRAILAFVEASGAAYVGATVLVDKTDDATRTELGVATLLPFDRIVQGVLAAFEPS